MAAVLSPAIEVPDVKRKEGALLDFETAWDQLRTDKALHREAAAAGASGHFCQLS